MWDHGLHEDHSEGLASLIVSHLRRIPKRKTHDQDANLLLLFYWRKTRPNKSLQKQTKVTKTKPIDRNKEKNKFDYFESVWLLFDVLFLKNQGRQRRLRVSQLRLSKTPWCSCRLRKADRAHIRCQRGRRDWTSDGFGAHPWKINCTNSNHENFICYIKNKKLRLLNLQATQKGSPPYRLPAFGSPSLPEGQSSQYPGS